MNGRDEVVDYLVNQERERISKGVGGDPAYRSYNMKNRAGLSVVFCAHSTRVLELLLDLDHLEVPIPNE